MAGNKMQNSPIPEVAARLRNFAQAVETKASALHVQTEPKRYTSAAPPKERILEIYEECLGKLTASQCVELDSLIY